MTTRISTEWEIPLEEVASWSWRKKEVYASSLAEMNRHDREQAERESEDYDTPDVGDVGGANVPNNAGTGNVSGGDRIGSGDHHPHLNQYSNVAKMHD